MWVWPTPSILRAMASSIQFVLNDREVTTSELPGTTVLDYLRQTERLTGTKEGCREGGCGACTVLLGELQSGGIDYRTVLACLLPLEEIRGRHLVTIEGLNRTDLSPVQQALVDCGATQCGFCTPGIVMSLTGYLLSPGADASREGIERAIGGNLCRCTGYSALKRACGAILRALSSQNQEGQLDGVTLGLLPPYFRDIPDRLRRLPQIDLHPPYNSEPDGELAIAGGTDLYVQLGDGLPTSPVHFLSRHPEMRGIAQTDGWVRVGALTTFSEFAAHPAVRQLVPDISAYMQRIASGQIRNRATVGGNIVGASPIADVTVLLLALNAQLVLKAGDRQRKVPLRSFYRGYKQIDKAPAELLAEVWIPVPDAATNLHFEKISKRHQLDCASATSAIALQCEGDAIRQVGIAVGGVAPHPLFLRNTSEYLVGQRVTAEVLQVANAIAQTEISPIDDIRGSIAYKRLLVRQLIVVHFIQLFPEFLSAEKVHATH